MSEQVCAKESEQACSRAGATSLKEFAGIEGEVGAAPGSVATPIGVDPFSLRMTFTVEVWAIYDICVVLYAANKSTVVVYYHRRSYHTFSNFLLLIQNLND